MSRSLAFGLMVTLLAAVPAAAAESASSPAAQDRNTEIVCKSVASEPGSRIGVRKVCMTRADWERKRQHDQQGLVHSQDNGLLATQN